MEKGVNKLEDANRLLPEDKPIEQKLDQARQEFETEKAEFPESAVFMDRLLANLKRL